MWLIVGLGNPGSRYARTRHNVGFMALEAFISQYLSDDFREKDDFRIMSGSIGDERLLLMEPLTFMNRSGMAVCKMMAKINDMPDRLIVLHDDLDLQTGKVKIRKKGSSGGHNGIQSIIDSIGSRDFVRVKIGIGRDPDMAPEKFVLAKFTKEEQPVIKDAINKSVEAVHEIITNGVDRAMNLYN